MYIGNASLSHSHSHCLRCVYLIAVITATLLKLSSLFHIVVVLLILDYFRFVDIEHFHAERKAKVGKKLSLARLTKNVSLWVYVYI